jgi:acetyl esterase/lipase
MQKLVTSLLFSILLITAKSQTCTDCRYLSPVFDSVTMETVHFGAGTRANGDTQQLYMDIYQPYGDTLSNRPVALFAFGGAFITGSRDDWYVKLVCEHLARTGYVTVSIDYRIYDDITQMVTEIFSAFPPQQMRIFFRPMQDMRGAVQYLKADYSELGNNYRIDTSKILIGGASSGAITSLMTAYCDKDSEMAEMAGGSLAALNALGGFYSSSGFYPNYSWQAAATFNVAGALINANWIEPGDVPVICAHGNADQVVPYKKGGFSGLTLGTFDMEGSYLVDSVARAKGVCSYLYTMEGKDHPSEDMGIEYFYSVVYRMALRMKAVISNQSFCCPLTANVTPGDTLYYAPNDPPSTLTAQITNDNGNAQLQWCTAPCQYTSNTTSLTVTPDTALKYVMLTASEGNCLSGDLHILADSTLINTGIKEQQHPVTIEVYPQPALGSFNVKAELNGVKSGSIEMFDLTGRKVLQQNFVAPGNTLQLKVQTENLPAGTYVLTVKDGSEIVGAKPITVQQ